MTRGGNDLVWRFQTNSASKTSAVKATARGATIHEHAIAAELARQRVANAERVTGYIVAAVADENPAQHLRLSAPQTIGTSFWQFASFQQNIGRRDAAH